MSGGGVRHSGMRFPWPSFGLQYVTRVNDLIKRHSVGESMRGDMIVVTTQGGSRPAGGKAGGAGAQPVRHMTRRLLPNNHKALRQQHTSLPRPRTHETLDACMRGRQRQA